jgi:hypothetical protein
LYILPAERDHGGYLLLKSSRLLAFDCGGHDVFAAVR